MNLAAAISKVDGGVTTNRESVEAYLQMATTMKSYIKDTNSEFMKTSDL